MAMIAAEVFGAFKAAGAEDELAKRAAAEVGDLHELIRSLDRRFAAVVDERPSMGWRPGRTAVSPACGAARRVRRSAPLACCRIDDAGLSLFHGLRVRREQERMDLERARD